MHCFGKTGTLLLVKWPLFNRIGVKAELGAELKSLRSSAVHM